MGGRKESGEKDQMGDSRVEISIKRRYDLISEILQFTD